jgi:peptidoglycan/xylan/chitin deacetylase (PgdA/CDA1 family)
VDVLLTATPGDVVLMHDGGGNRSQTVEALAIALPQLTAKGYNFGITPKCSPV